MSLYSPDRSWTTAPSTADSPGARAIDTRVVAVAGPVLGGGRVQTAFHRSAVKRGSHAVPARVLAEGARHLVRLGSPAQLRDLVVLERGLAIDGVLQSL